MKMLASRKWFLAGALAPVLLAGFALSACDDEDEIVTPPIVDGGPGLDGSADAVIVPPTGDGGSEAGTPPVCTTQETPVNADITVNTTWTCPSYLLKRMVYVTSGATLTIAPGVKIMADTAVANPRPGLIISRGSKIMAKGTKTSPILFTSQNLPGARASGDIAGLALLGSARINSGACVGDGNPATTACDAPGYLETNVEGLPATEPRTKFGGVDDTGSCGELEYVRIEFAGAELSPNNELNGLTLGGCGSATKLSYIQVHRGKDDGIEFFGGTVGMDHVVVTGDEDDAVDWDLGWRGKAQFVVIQKWAGFGDNGFESDNLGERETAEPRSAPQLYNFTMVGTATTKAMTLREGTRGIFKNFLIQGFGGANVDVQWKDPTIMPATEWPMFLSVENTAFWMNKAFGVEATDNDFGFDEKASFEDPLRKNLFAVDPMLTSVVELAPNFTPKNAALLVQAVPVAGFDTTAAYSGAIAPNAATSWLDGWTAFPKD